MEKGVLKNLSWLVIANILTKPLWFVFVIYSANILGVKEFGIYTFSMSFLLMFSILLDLGLEQLLIRDVAKKKEQVNFFFNNAISYKLIASWLVFVILLLIISIFDYSNQIRISLLIMYFFVLSTSFITFLRAFFRAFEKIKYESISILIEKFCLIFFATIGLFSGIKLFGFLIGLVIGNFICLIISFIILFRKIESLKFKPQINQIKILLKSALPFLIADIFIIIYFRLSSILIMFITGSENQVGLYNSSYRLIEMYLAFPIMLVTPVYPFISRTFIEDKKRCYEVAGKILKLLLIVATPITIIVFFDYVRINQLLFTSQYIEAASGLQIIILTIIPLSANVLFGTILAAINRQKEAAFTVGVCTLVNIVLNLILIYYFQYIGATITIVISESLISLLYFIFVKKYFGNFGLKKFLNIFLIIVILFCFVCYFASLLKINIILYCSLSLLFYFLLLVFFKLLRKSQFIEYYKIITSK